MPLLKVPANIQDKYKAANVQLKNKGISKAITQYKDEYDKLCAKLLALEIVSVSGFLDAADKTQYLLEINERLERFYQGTSGTATARMASSATATAGTMMSCYPLQQCGNRCCFNTSLEI